MRKRERAGSVTYTGLSPQEAMDAVAAELTYLHQRIDYVMVALNDLVTRNDLAVHAPEHPERPA